MNAYIKHYTLLAIVFIALCHGLQAQDKTQYSLQQLIDSTVSENHIVAIKEWQLREKTSKLNEDGIKRYPSVTLNGNYQYNFSLGELNIPAGLIGSVPNGTGTNQLLPAENTKLQVGQHSNYSGEVSLYQPLLQQAKIKTGLDIDRIDIARAEKEKVKVIRELKLGVQKLYYTILIIQKQQEEATNRLNLAMAKLADAQSAAAAGKTITSNLAGLQAAVAGEEQNVLKLDIQLQDYKRELINTANLQNNTDITLEPLDTIATVAVTAGSADRYTNSMIANTDLQITQLDHAKALLGIKAARRSNLPDIGLIAGYYYQKGNPILPTSSPYIGINLRWNLQDLFANQQVVRQREAQLKQAEHQLAYQQQQLRSDLEKAYRKVNQNQALMSAAQKALRYRYEELKVEQDKQSSGLAIKSNLLEVKANVAKAEADSYAAQLSCLLAIAELENLAGH